MTIEEMQEELWKEIEWQQDLRVSRIGFGDTRMNISSHSKQKLSGLVREKSK